MENISLIPITEFCSSHQVKIETIKHIHNHGLIEISTIEGQSFIPEYEIRRLEKIIVFYNELAINLEGIETILQLLQRMEKAQKRIDELENELHRYL